MSETKPIKESLSVTHPDLAREWDYDKNAPLNPEIISSGSNKKVWWKCSNGHEWEATVNNRSNGRGCPYCSNHRVLKGYNDLATFNPELAADWDYEKNGSLTPYDVVYKSSRMIWWKCANGHSWTDSISHRSDGRGCPYCSNHRVLKGFNDLATSNPDLAKEWNYEKNGTLTPYDVVSYSDKKAWWKCSNGHEWEAKISNRSKGKGCPFCSGRLALSGVNDLSTLHPELVKEWNYEKNYPLTPKDVTSKSSNKVWWKCSNEHEWQAVIASRSAGRGCPYCSGRIVTPGVNDFASLFPNLLTEWDYERNTPLTPNEIMPGSQKRYWWKCSNGHSWLATPYTRSNGSGCPYCSRHIVLSGVNDLATTNPDLSKEWNYEKNSPLTPKDVLSGSPRKVWWKCSKGHEWQASISNRSKGRGCPKCQYTGSSKPEQGIYYYLSLCFKTESRVVINKQEIDIYLPDYKIGIEYDGLYYHRNRHSKEESKNRILKEAGILLFRIKESDKNYISNNYIHYIEDDMGTNYTWALQTLFNMIADLCGNDAINKIDINVNRDSIRIRELFALVQKTNSFAIKYPETAKEWNYEKNGILTPEMFNYGSNEKVWWKCSRGHEWKASISHRSNGRGCPYCSGKICETGINDLATLYPKLTKEWNYEKNPNLSPTDVIPGSEKKVWWKCTKGHEWQAVIYNRVKGIGCPYCSGRLAISGKNDLATLYPELAKEWDYEKNSSLTPKDVTSKTAKKAWWKCSKGHSWNARISDRSNGCNCPYCSGKSVIIGENDLATLLPEISKEWNVEKNGSLSPKDVSIGSSKKVWWKCAKGHEWQATISHRSRGQGCPYCSGRNHPNIICIETGATFKTLSEAAKYCGLNSSSPISLCCKGKNKTAGGYHWKYSVPEEKIINTIQVGGSD